MATIQYTSRLVSTAADGVLVEAAYMKDEAIGKLQSEINADLYSKVSNIYTPKGSVETFEDLPTDAAPGDVYNVKSAVTLEDGTTYPAGSNFVWIDGEPGRWDYIGGSVDNSEAKEYCDGKLTELREEISGQLTEITGRLEALETGGAVKEEILEETKSYVDNKINESLTWIEDEDLFSGDEETNI